MDQAEIEALLKQKHQNGLADTGLYDTGLQYVVMDVVGEIYTFQWFSSLLTLDDLGLSKEHPVAGAGEFTRKRLKVTLRKPNWPVPDPDIPYVIAEDAEDSGVGVAIFGPDTLAARADAARMVLMWNKALDGEALPPAGALLRSAQDLVRELGA